jgi:hypothetical protein
MSKRTDAVDRDFESLLRGLRPTEAELAAAPVLDMWSSEVVEGGGKKVVVLHGFVTKHPTNCDGSRVTIYDLIWLDHDHRWARSTRTLYRLDGAEILIEGLPL